MDTTNPELVDLVDRVASSVARQYRVDRADLRQEGWVWCLSHKDKVTEYGTAQHGTGKLWTALRNHLSLLARAEKAHQEGYEVDDQTYYSTTQVRTLLIAAFTPDWSTRGAVYDGDPTGNTGASDPSDVWAMVADVKAGFVRLQQVDKDLLWQVYGEPGTWQEHIKELATEVGCTESAMDKRVRRALGRVRKHLGGPRPREDQE